MSGKDFTWNYKTDKKMRKSGVSKEEREASKRFMSTYLQGPEVNPRGVITHLIPSAQYSTKQERDRYEAAVVAGGVQ